MSHNHQASQASQALERTLQDFEAFLLHSAPKLASFHPHYEDAAWEMLKNGGKRFRPALLFSVILPHAPHMIQNAFLPALSLECIHTYSLIHDDLPCMDNAALRRGHPTLHTKYSQTLALLVGDGLNTHAFALLASSKLDPLVRCEMIETLALDSGLGGMVLGQMLDCEFEKERLSLEQVEFIHTHKTAKLIAASLKMGALIAGLPSHDVSALYEFGLKLGLYFQLRDDLIDVCLDSEKAGKSTQKDSDKNSYVSLLGLESAKKEFAKQREDLQSQLEGFEPRLSAQLGALLKNYFKDIV